MLEGKTPEEFSYPGSLEFFGSETLIPFIGSLADSLCGVSVNEKKTCPTCRQSVDWNLHNNPAIEKLTAAAEKDAEDSKKSKLDVREETNASDEPVPPILDPKNRLFLAQIVNQLNPTSFLNLASTCKTLQEYCFNSKDIKISHDIFSIAVKMDDADGFKFAILEQRDWDLEEDEDYVYKPRFISLDYTGYRHGFLSSAYGRKQLRKYPFEFRLEDFELMEVNRFDDAFFTPLRTLFAELHIKTVPSILMLLEDNSWVFPAVSEEFMKFLKDFRIMDVHFEGSQFAEDISEEFLNYFLQNTASFSQYNMDIPVEMLMKASVPRLWLRKSISSKTFADLLKKFSDRTDEIVWYLNDDPIELRQDALRQFNILPFRSRGPLPLEQPIIFVKDSVPGTFWLLRKDGKVMECTNEPSVKFSMCPPRRYPPYLRHKA